MDSEDRTSFALLILSFPYNKNPPEFNVPTKFYEKPAVMNTEITSQGDIFATDTDGISGIDITYELVDDLSGAFVLTQYPDNSVKLEFVGSFDTTTIASLVVKVRNL